MFGICISTGIFERCVHLKQKLSFIYCKRLQYYSTSIYVQEPDLLHCNWKSKFSFNMVTSSSWLPTPGVCLYCITNGFDMSKNSRAIWSGVPIYSIQYEKRPVEGGYVVPVLNSKEVAKSLFRCIYQYSISICRKQQVHIHKCISAYFKSEPKYTARSEGNRSAERRKRELVQNMTVSFAVPSR